jgi:hypothetical protein
MSYCSSCGGKLSEDANFCASCGAPTRTEKPLRETVAAADVERIIYQGASGALVSTTRAVLNGVTYPIASISSVRMVQMAASCWGPALIVIGLIALVIGIGGQSFGPGVFGVIMAAIGIAIVTAKKERAIVLATMGGETTALKSIDHATIATIVDALNQAIVERG